MPGFELVEVPDAEVPLADAISSYLFNAQLVTPPDGAMTLVAPTECRDTPTVAGWIERHLASNGAIRRVEVRRCPPIDGQWRRPGLPAASRPVRPGRCRPAVPGRRRQARPAGGRHRHHWPEKSHRKKFRTASLVAEVERARSVAGRAGLAELDSPFWDSPPKRFDPTQFFSYRGTVKGQLTTVLNRERAERRHSRGVGLTMKCFARSAACLSSRRALRRIW